MESITVGSLKDSARIWIYKADRVLNDKEIECVNRKLDQFLDQWNTHGKNLVAEAWIEDKVFIILAIDEDHQAASGCSIDQSVHFIRQIGDRMNIDFFDRMVFVYQDDEGEPHFVGARDLCKIYEKGIVDDDTLFYNTLLEDKGSWNQKKMQPLAKSWHSKFL